MMKSMLLTASALLMFACAADRGPARESTAPAVADLDDPVVIPPPTTGPCPCPAVIDWVCGTDGVTYQNACHAACANVKVKHKGQCEKDTKQDVASL